MHKSLRIEDAGQRELGMKLNAFSLPLASSILNPTSTI
jgi:hypothetical protein